MVGCVEIKSTKYQTRKSPAYHAKDCKGLSKKGKDGNYISKADASGVYKWVKVNTTRKMSGKHYDIHDNRGRPFRVYIDGNKVANYKDINKDWNKPADFSKLIKEVKAKEIYIGKSTGHAAGADHRPDEAKIFVGNTILLQISANKYIHIGSSIYEFEMEDKVDKYFSMVGNNDVPYPVLLGTENVYFMLEDDHKYVPRDKFPENLTNAQWEDAYTYYYGWTDPVDGHHRTDEERKKENLENFAKRMIGYKLIQKREF